LQPNCFTRKKIKKINRLHFFTHEEEKNFTQICLMPFCEKFSQLFSPRREEVQRKSKSKEMESRKSGLPKALQDSAPAGIFNLGSSANAETANVSQQNRVQLMYKNAMAFAKSPMSSIFMTAFMMYMTGNSLQIFSIVMLAMAFWNPTQAIINVEKCRIIFVEQFC
jgi:hypothetical protein